MQIRPALAVDFVPKLQKALNTFQTLHQSSNVSFITYGVRRFHFVDAISIFAAAAYEDFELRIHYRQESLEGTSAALRRPNNMVSGVVRIGKIWWYMRSVNKTRKIFDQPKPVWPVL